MLTMSEFLDAEIHDSIDSLELRWRYEEKEYGLVVTPEMFDLLAVAQGECAPVLVKIMMQFDGWQNGGVSVGAGRYSLEVQ